MAEPGLILVTGAGGGVGGVGGKVVALLLQPGRALRAMAHHDDHRADALRALGADVVVGDLTRPADVATALDSVKRMFFSMSLTPSYLEATATVATVARAVGDLDALVAISQMTVSQMDALSMSESHHQRMHWLSEQVLNWSGLPVVHVRPTVFLDNPLFTTLAARLGDVLSSMYLASMVLKHHENQGREPADLPLVEWACRSLLYQAQEQLHLFLRNFPNRPLAAFMRLLIFPRGLTYFPPSDRLGRAIAELIMNPTAARERLTQHIYKTGGANNPLRS